MTQMRLDKLKKLDYNVVTNLYDHSKIKLGQPSYAAASLDIPII